MVEERLEGEHLYVSYCGRYYYAAADLLVFVGKIGLLSYVNSANNNCSKYFTCSTWIYSDEVRN